MNIISQNCLAGHIYKNHFDKKYGNPFVWSVIDFDSMKCLIEHYDELNFDRFELSVKNDIYSMLIDNSVKVQYVHYRYGQNTVPTKIGGDLYYNKIEEFIVERYNKLKTIMLSEREQPIFCFRNCNTLYKDCIYTNEQLLELEKYDNARVIISDKKVESVEAGEEIFNKYLK